MRTVVVTGSASGLGAAIRAHLERDGWAVIGVDLQGQEVAADLSTDDGRAGLVPAVEAALGGAEGEGLDGLVACAGVGPHVEPTELIVGVDFFGAVATLEGLEPLLRRGTSPVALAIASNSLGIIPADEQLVAACAAADEAHARRRAAELDGSTVYGNAKLALARWVRAHAEAWGRAGVRLNALAPGPIETPLLQASRDDAVLGPHVDALPIPLGRTAQPDEIAALAAFLLSDEAAMVHGSVLFADGGTDAQFRPDHA
jgi:3alpha-hydroxysteroid 3-dehydrogenase